MLNKYPNFTYSSLDLPLYLGCYSMIDAENTGVAKTEPLECLVHCKVKFMYQDILKKKLKR